MNLAQVGATSLRARINALAAFALLGLSLGLVGCTGDIGATGPSGASSTLSATGTIQGRLIDSASQQPIVNALVDIGVASASTNAQGQFVLTNVPVAVDDNNNDNADSYRVTINMKSVTSPVDMTNTAATPRYADFAIKDIDVSFTSPYTVGGSAVPVTGLVANAEFGVGKLAATITGAVINGTTRVSVGAGYTVKLVSTYSEISGGDANGTGTGSWGDIAGTTTTDANGNYTFANIESMQYFNIEAFNTAQTMRGNMYIEAPADGETKILIQNNPILVASTDNLAPRVASVTPEQNSDISTVGGVSVVYTFSEPIKQTPLTSTSASIPGSLYYTVDVNVGALKASNIVRTLAWNATFTQLTVTIPTLAASYNYSVTLATTGASLQDANNQTVTNLGVAGKGLLNFTTNGSATPVAPVIAVVAPLSLNFNSTVVSLDWPAVSGAKSYNVYRSQNYPSAAGQPTRVNVAANLVSSYADTVPASPTVPFVNGQQKLTYSYTVRSVSADGAESANSNSVTAEDKVAPTAPGVAAFATGASTYTVLFGEPMDETTAETVANYALTQGASATAPATITSAVLQSDLVNVIITLSGPTVTGNILSVTTIPDIAGNPMTGATRTFP